jgi:outer membrane protein OmpA-like peptidoglycan-associated protein
LLASAVMKLKLAGVAGALAFVLAVQPTPPADACGVKLTIKPSGPKRAVARSSHPSQVLLLGTHPRKFERDLSSAGHAVEVAPNAGAARRKTYAVVVADNTTVDEARTSFPSSVVLVRSGDNAADIRTLEASLSRKPVGADNRAVVAAERKREPVAAGPEPKDAKTMVASREPEAAKVEPKPEPPPKPEPKEAPAVAAVAAPKSEPIEKAEKVAPEARPKAVPAGTFRAEFHFGFAAHELSNREKRQLDGTVRWLTANADVSVSIEGHADPIGSAANNQRLSEVRAESVKEYLVGKGIDGARLEVIGHGDTKLKYGRSDGRNRRVELKKK